MSEKLSISEDKGQPKGINLEDQQDFLALAPEVEPRVPHQENQPKNGLAEYVEQQKRDKEKRMKAAFGVDDVKESEKNESEETVIGKNEQAAQETKIGEKEATQTRVEILNEQMVSLNALIKEKRETVEKELSKEGLSSAEKEIWLERKKEMSKAIIEKGCEFLGRDFKEEEAILAQEEEAQWQVYVESFGGKEKYKAWEQQELLRNSKALNACYEATIKSSKLSENQQEELNREGQIIARTLLMLHDIKLTKEDAALCTWAGLDVSKISRGFLGLSEKIKVGDQTFQNLDGLNYFLTQKKKEYIAEEAEIRSIKRREMIVTRAIRQPVLDEQIHNLKQKILEKRDIENNKARWEHYVTKWETREKEAEEMIEG